MNRSLRKELFREIRGSFTRFLSIFVMVGLGCMFLVGLRSAAPDMRKTADGYFDGQNYMDLQVMSTLGLTQEDIDALSQVDGVETAEGGWSLDAICSLPDSDQVVKLLSLSPSGINAPIVVEGRLPEAKNECAVEEKLLTYFHVKVGDQVTITPGEEQQDALAEKTYTITGVVQSPLYISIERGTSTLGDGSVDAYMLLPEDSFHLDYYTVCNVIADGAKKMDAYLEAYRQKIDDLAARLTETAEVRGELRYQQVKDDAQAKVDEAKTQLAEAQQQAEDQIADGESQLEAARAELDRGWQDLNLAQALLGELQVPSLEENRKTLEDGEAEYAESQEKLETARQEAQDQLTQGQQDIDDAQKKVDELEPATVYVLDRNSNYGFVSYDQNAQRMANLANMFPVIFFLVAALVCLTTMTRMVEEERTEIGSIKAMGYGTGTIAVKYLLYGAIAAVGGGIVGVAIGTTLIPWVIFTSYGIMYNLPSLHLELYWPLSLGSIGAGVACTVGATLWAMLATARETPAALMRPKAPKAGKRILLEHIPFLWKHFSFSVKVCCRNLFRYKKRFFMTVIGIAGCTALMIAGLGLRSSIFSIIDIQYGDIYRYNLQVSMDPDTGDPTAISQAAQADENTASLADIYTRAMTASSPEGSQDGYITVTDDPEALYEQITLRNMDKGDHIEIPQDGVVISEKLAELLKLKVGDTITLECGSKAQTRVAGITEHYVRHYVYMTSSLYTELFGGDYTPNELLVTAKDTGDDAMEQMSARLMEEPGVTAVSNIGAAAHNFEENMKAVNAAVTIIIISAAALALVVLYNLTNINITERIRELATIKVLGFYDREVAMYIYRENMVLTILGIALGQLLGKYLCSYLIRTIELDFVMFGRQALVQNYVMSVVLSLIFALAVNFLMYFRMKKIDMVQSLKSVE